MRNDVLIDARRHHVDQLVSDVCIIGSGAAGISIAVELIRAGHDVVLLEAGGPGADPRADGALSGSVSGDEHEALDAVRVRRAGGTTEVWGGRCAPLDPLDLEGIPGRAPSWPIDFSDLRPYYDRAQQYCEVGRFEYRSAEALPGSPTLVPLEQGAFVTDEKIWRWGPPARFWRRYHRLLAAAANLRFVLRATVVRLERDPLSGSIKYAHARVAAGRELRVSSRIFVLATGGLEAARLLLASNDRSTHGIGNENGLVGRFYTTHFTVETGHVTLTRPAAVRAGGFLISRDGIYCRRMLALTDETRAREGLLNAAASIWYPDPLDPAHRDGLLSTYALIRAGLARSGLHWKSKGLHRRYAALPNPPGHVANVVRDLGRVGRYSVTFARARWLSPRSIPFFFVLPQTGSARLRVDIEQEPRQENRAALSRDRDEFGVPRLDVRCRLGSDDRESLRRSLEILRDAFARLGVGTVQLQPDPEVAPFGGGPHQMGLTRMGHTPRDGVVDAQCVVFGTKNLYITGSSVFPSGGAVGPTLTLVALALRASDRIRSELASRVEQVGAS